MKSKTILAGLFLASLMPATLWAQQSEDPQPAAPAPAPAPERDGIVKRSVKHFLNDDDRPGEGAGLHWGPIYPRVVILSSGGGPGPALHLWARDIGSTSIDFHASAAYTIYKYQYFDAQFGLLPHVDKRLPRFETGTNALFPLADIEKTSAAPGFNIYASARYRDYPREDFFGVGPNSLRANHTDYRLQDGLYEGVVRFRVSRLSVMGRAGVLHTSILEGTDPADPNAEVLFNNSTAPGLLRSPDFNHMSGGAWLELRDEPGNPHKGAAFGAAYAHFDERNGNRYEFNRLSIDAREYLKLGSNRNVIALRQALSMDDPEPGAVVPFYLRPTLGGSNFFRAYSSFRFRDDRLLYLASEYRFEFHPKVELALIYETGKVFPDSQNVSLRDMRRGYGAGLRFKSTKKVHVRLDVVHGIEGNRIHLKLGPAF